MANLMKRFLEESKEVLWEKDLYDGLYNSIDGNEGIYKSEDGKYFYAKYHKNGFTYNGEDILRILPEDIAKKAVAANYDNDSFVTDNKLDYPTWYLINNNWI